MKRAGLKQRRVFVTSGKPQKSRGGPWEKLAGFCKSHHIELTEINTVVRDVIVEFRRRMLANPSIIGKEDGIGRLLVHLVWNGFLVP